MNQCGTVELYKIYCVADPQVFRERRDQEQRERDRLDKERRDREEREREREREREKARLKEQRDRQAMEDVNRHFELSIEFAKKVGRQLHFNIDSTNRSQVSPQLKYLDSLLSQFQS